MIGSLLEAGTQSQVFVDLPPTCSSSILFWACPLSWERQLPPWTCPVLMIPGRECGSTYLPT